MMKFSIALFIAFVSFFSLYILKMGKITTTKRRIITVYITTISVCFFSTEARAEIVGPPIRYLTPGSTLKLICRIVQNTEASAFIFWYHDNRMINYDVDRGINVSTEAGIFLSISIT